MQASDLVRIFSEGAVTEFNGRVFAAHPEYPPLQIVAVDGVWTIRLIEFK